MIKEAPGNPSDLPSTGKSANQADQLRNRSHSHYTQWAAGDGVTVLFFLDKSPRDVTQMRVSVAGMVKRPADRGTAYDWSLSNGTKVTFTVAPGNGDDIAFEIVT